MREILATLGFKSLAEAVGQVEVLETKAAVDHWKASGLDLAPLLKFPEVSPNAIRRNTTTQDHGLAAALDNALIVKAMPALERKTPTKISLSIKNGNRTVGTMLGSEITRRFGNNGLPENTIDITFHGSAGQSLGAFIPNGLTIRLLVIQMIILVKAYQAGELFSVRMRNLLSIPMKMLLPET